MGVMRFGGLVSVWNRNLIKCALFRSINIRAPDLLIINYTGRRVRGENSFIKFSSVAAAEDDASKGHKKLTLAKDLACLVEESTSFDTKSPKSRMELKRSLELRIKKRVKEQYVNGKFQNLMAKVIANPDTLQDAYDCIRLNSNVDIAQSDDRISFESIADELRSGNFNFKTNSTSISTRGARKEVLVLPNLKSRIVQEAVRIILEVVYKPHFSKISHGCRSGRGHFTALKYIRKEISSPDWWFTLLVNKRADACIISKLISMMEEKIEDIQLYETIRFMFEADVLNFEFGGFPKGQGLPQEGILSPILMNIYLDLLDREFYRLSMIYEALNPQDLLHDGGDKSHSKLRNWFQRQLKGSDHNCTDKCHFGARVYCCRFMDEIFFAFSGSKDTAFRFKAEIARYLKDFLHLNVDDDQTEILPCNESDGIRFLGTFVRRTVLESPATRAVHKLKEKIKLFVSQKQEAWDAGTVRIGKKWLGHGLRKVKESEIKHLADAESTLSKISCFRKDGMETDHWYKFLIKVWMEDIKAKKAENEESLLSKYVAEPALPQELRDSYYEFVKRANDYISSETAAAEALLSNSSSNHAPITITEVVAPVNAIKKRLFRYGLTTSKGHPRTSNLLVLQDDDQIIDWYSGIGRRWISWYRDCNNFNEVKPVISTLLRKSCIRTLAAKYRIHESKIEKRFDSELSCIPSTEEIEQEMTLETPDCYSFNNDEALMYGISYSGVCMLSLARIVSQSRPCKCFVLGCSEAAPNVYSLHVMERQKFPGWKTGFAICIHPSLNRRRIGLCKKHLKDLYLGHVSLQSVDFGAWN